MFVIPAVSSYAIIGRGSLPPERALTMTTAGYAAGNIISPILGGLIAAQFGLRSLFSVAAVLFVLSTVVMFLVKHQPPRPHTAQRNFSALFAEKGFVGYCLLVLVVWVVIWIGIPLSPNFLADVRGLTVSQVSILGSFNALGWVTLSLVLGRRAPRRGFMVAQVLIMLYLAILLRASWFGWIAVAYVARAAQFAAHSLVNAQATRIVAPERLGIAFGVLETVAWAGTVVGPLVAGRLYALDPARPFQISLALMPVMLLLTYLFSPRASRAASPAPADGLPAAEARRLPPEPAAPPTGMD